MPSFGISDADCEGDENFAGHEDLLFRRTLFQTVHPLEKIRSVQDGGQKPSAQVSSYSNISLLTSSTGSEKSFEFLGTPATSLPSTETMSKMAYLDAYNGSRPSFGLGTLTSTPFTFSKKIAVVQPTSNVNLNLENCVAESVKSNEDVTVATEGSALKASLKNRSDPAPKQPSSLDGFYVKEMEIADDYDKAKKRVEEDKNQKALRALTKRTIVEKVTVESKKTASLQEISSVSGFLCKLLNGMVVTGTGLVRNAANRYAAGTEQLLWDAARTQRVSESKTVLFTRGLSQRYGDKSLQLPDGDFRCYGFVITIESYMGIVERDPLLVLVISRILILLCANVPKFESVLMGKLLRMSQLLTLNQEKCAAYAEQLSSIEDRRFALIPETSIIKLFVHLHVTAFARLFCLLRRRFLFPGSACKGMAHFTSEALWRVVSFLTEESCRTIATAAMLLEIVENGSIPLEKADSRKWSTVLKKISSSLVPKLQDQVDEDDLRRSIGEDSLVASLRHAVSRRSSG
ncbi:unnamed protein product [Heligmosomoides polygyrus]|uniref:Nucleoporin GLE1 n=1 Tax=Heligmosomoides polygyrus TaxID=6339 RepID=A0A3P8BZQ2_HELPZ|nr:unnamed protein product [Heligmosomoides polygyrus]